jgi:hydroxyacylglutathione hydrolase
MFIEKIKTPGLAHLSYVVGAAGQAVVIDPRLDCEIYIEKAALEGCRISHILETHRNEDLVTGSAALAELTGAQVYHGPDAAGEVVYADTILEGEGIEMGSLKIKAIETPGHTFDSMSYALYDTEFGESAVAVFTGDTLFVGDVGRTDFYPDQAEKVAGLLFDSLQKLIQLGDQTLIYPAHGAGSVCGNDMADREFSSIGYERQHNPMLKIESRDEFIDKKCRENHEMPPYFERMEALNLSGAEMAGRNLTATPLTIEAFTAQQEHCLVLDVRSVSAFMGAHIPNSLAMPESMVPAFAGWLLDYADNILLVADDQQQADTALRHLNRIDYRRVQGSLIPSLTGWAKAAKKFSSLATVNAESVKDRVLSDSNDWQLIDVRSEHEFDTGHIEGAVNIYVGRLPEKLDTLDKQKSYTVMCESGARATIAASVLLRAGFKQVDVFLGAMGAWRTVF